MITVEAALLHLFDLVAPVECEFVSLENSCGRVLAKSVKAQRDQPPFAASAMDGYAVSNEVLVPGLELEVIGEAAAGKRFHEPVELGQTVRIFTGAPMPKNCDRVIIQENVERSGDKIRILSSGDPTNYVRPAGSDFIAGAEVSAPRILKPSDIALLASMNVAKIMVRKRPIIALISNGDELVMPGQEPGEDQIITSNTFGLAALLREYGAAPRILPIARDSLPSLQTAFKLAEGSDLIVTIGGASVGDHDLVATAASEIGFNQNFYKVAMRPGKPLMAGRLNGLALVGLPGNPVSAMVCGHIFLIPMINAMLGLEAKQRQRRTANIMHEIAANGPREHYMRATLCSDGIYVAEQQDSALLSVLAHSNALALRPPFAPALLAGAEIEYIPI